MSEIKKLAPFVLKWEGGFVNDPADKGGATNKGVTIAVWQKQGYDKNKDGKIDVKDLKNLSDEDATAIMKKHYWDRWKADQIKDQRVANTLVDWLWCSGAWGIKIPQKILGLKVDGIVGEKTITAVNNAPANFLQTLYKERQEFLERIAKTNPTQKRFLKGWMNRMNDLKKWNERFLK